ncbi:hypothetical protein [Streptomyces sp. NPDC001843]|uniref:DUF7848 domain-containing protein n=1 Tax=Streptomyces sp. NPDC001843 TaxID=3364617 RepID=UPI0036AD2750
MTRSLFKHIRWVFRVLLEDPPLYSARCKVCEAEPDANMDDPFDAESWCMRHAAQSDDQGRHHTSFAMIQVINATVRPHPDDLSKVGPGWELAIAE